jgi:hypothetical protein
MPAPRRNTNALKHGLYARYFNHDARRDMKKMPEDDLTFEIAACRHVLGLIVQNFDASTVESRTKDSASFAAVTNALANCVRIQRQRGHYSLLDEALEEALDHDHPYETPTPTQYTLPGIDPIPGTDQQPG